MRTDKPENDSYPKNWREFTDFRVVMNCKRQVNRKLGHVVQIHVSTSLLLRLERQQKRFLKMHFEFAYFPFFMLFFLEVK